MENQKYRSSNYMIQAARGPIKKTSNYNILYMSPTSPREPQLPSSSQSCQESAIRNHRRLLWSTKQISDFCKPKLYNFRCYSLLCDQKVMRPSPIKNSFEKCKYCKKYCNLHSIRDDRISHHLHEVR